MEEIGRSEARQLHCECVCPESVQNAGKEDRNMRKLFTWLLSFFVILAVAFPQNALSDQESISRRIPEGHRYYDLDFNNCEETWQILWSDFLEGKQDSSAFITTLIFFRGLRVPRPSHDMPMVMRDIVFFAIHSVDTSQLTRETLNSIREYFVSDHWEFFFEEGYQRSNCFMSDTYGDDCIDLAVDDGVIPALEDYMREIELAQNSGISAYCDQEAAVGP